jgi:hypothetical protein
VDFPEFVKTTTRHRRARSLSRCRGSETASRQIIYEPCITHRLRHTRSRFQGCLDILVASDHTCSPKRSSSRSLNYIF